MPVFNNGWIISKNAPQYMPTWEMNKEIGQYAESIGFDFLFSAVKWRGSTVRPNTGTTRSSRSP